jgi:hypothetical protein
VNHFGAYTFHTCEDHSGSKMKRRNELPRSVVRVCNSPDPLITPLKFPLKRPISPNSVAILIAELWNCCFHDVIMPGHHADYFPTETECWIELIAFLIVEKKSHHLTQTHSARERAK